MDPSIRNKFCIFEFTFARVEKVWNTVNQRGIGNVGQMELHRMYHHDRAYPPSFGKWRTTIVWIRMQRRTTRKGNFLDGKFVRCPIVARVFSNAYLIPTLLLLITSVILLLIYQIFQFLFEDYSNSFFFRVK